MKDKIKFPSHYLQGKECREVIKDFLSDEAFEGYLTGNVLKYLYRWKHKNGTEDLKKANEYIKYLISINEKKQKENLKE